MNVQHLADNPNLQYMLDRLYDVMRNKNLKINIWKTKIIAFDKKD